MSPITTITNLKPIFRPYRETYIEKRPCPSMKKLKKLRLSTTSSLLSGRRDVLVVACLRFPVCMELETPLSFKKNVIHTGTGSTNFSETKFMHPFWYKVYTPEPLENLVSGNFRVKGDIIDVFPGYADTAYRIHFFGDEVEADRNL